MNEWLRSIRGVILTGGNRNYRRETCFWATLSITNLILTDLDLNQRLRCERSASNRHSMAWINPKVTGHWEKKNDIFTFIWCVILKRLFFRKSIFIVQTLVALSFCWYHWREKFIRTYDACETFRAQPFCRRWKIVLKGSVKFKFTVIQQLDTGMKGEAARMTGFCPWSITL